MERQGAHMCEFHHEECELDKSLARYVTEGLEAGEAVVAVVADKRMRLLENLVERLPQEHAQRLVLLDSSKLLYEFMHLDEPERALFRNAVRPILDKAAASGNGKLRVYGEMVNDLWHAGNPAAAVRLEELWNELLEEYDFSLFCGYVLDAFDPDSSSPWLAATCQAHTHVSTTADEARVRAAVDEASQEVLGIQLSSVLRHSQPAGDTGYMRLPPSRRAILWLKENTGLRLVQLLDVARQAYSR